MKNDGDLMFLLGIALVTIGIVTRVWAFVGAGAFFTIMASKRKAQGR